MLLNHRTIERTYHLHHYERRNPQRNLETIILILLLINPHIYYHLLPSRLLGYIGIHEKSLANCAQSMEDSHLNHTMPQIQGLFFNLTYKHCLLSLLNIAFKDI